MPDMKMTPDDALALRDAAENVNQYDHLVGSVLRRIVAQLAHAHGLDIDDESAKARTKAEDAQKAREDAMRVENERIEQERAQVRATMHESENIPVPLASLPSQQQSSQEPTPDTTSTKGTK